MSSSLNGVCAGNAADKIRNYNLVTINVIWNKKAYKPILVVYILATIPCLNNYSRINELKKYPIKGGSVKL